MFSDEKYKDRVFLYCVISAEIVAIFILVVWAEITLKAHIYDLIYTHVYICVYTHTQTRTRWDDLKNEENLYTNIMDFF